ncbi:Nn.00g099830.m01.CDS01 [Neocucurbitaria sp. VM-36]
MAEKSTTETIEGTAPGKSKAQILTDVYSLAMQFSTCVEAFNLIHPSKDHDHAQKVALAKLGLQQGRLLIFGGAVGICAPPATIARHMIPSHPGLTNPDPHLPVNFGVRDPRLDNEIINGKIRRALHEIAGRPQNMSREELMNVYGMKSPKSFARFEYPALDTNRLEGFREQYALLQDLVRQSGARASIKRNLSMTTNHWTVKDSTRFNHFVKTVRTEVDALIELMGVKEQVDRGTRSDIRCMAWHPELTGPIVQQDWEKLRLIREACEGDYPEYIEVADAALQYINEELKETSLAKRRASLGLAAQSNSAAAGARRKSDYDIRSVPPKTAAAEKSHLQLSAERALDPNSGKEKRPSIFSKFKSWSSKNNKNEKTRRSQSLPYQDPPPADPQRSMSEAEPMPGSGSAQESANALEPVRSKSLSAIPDEPTLDLDSRVRNLSVSSDNSPPPPPPTSTNTTTLIPDLPAVPETGGEVKTHPERLSVDEHNALTQVDTVGSEGSEQHGLSGVTTVNSLIDRHDMYQGMGRIETKDIRDKAHELGG